MANNRPASARILNTNPSEARTQTRMTATASNSRVSSAPTTKQKLSSIPTDTTLSNERFVCFLLDHSSHHLEEHEKIQAELRKIIDHLRVFDDADECEHVIRKMTNEKIILVSSDALGRQIVPRLHDLSQLSACYIYYHNESFGEHWSSGYTKVCAGSKRDSRIECFNF